MQKIIYSVLVFAFVFLSTGATAQAADFRVGAKNNGSVSIGVDEDITNLYTAGNIITIDANVEKGVHAAGNIININGNVGNSVYSAGGTLLISGDVAGSVHGAGGNIIVESNIADDVIVAGGNMMISKEATIGGDLVVGAGTLDLLGSVGGNIYMSGGVVTLNGSVGGDVKIDQVDELTIGKDSVINGNLEYYSKNEIVIEDGAVINGETILNTDKGMGKERREHDRGAFVGALFAIISIALFIKMIGLMIIALIFAFVFKKLTESTVKEGLNHFWKSLGLGFAILVLTPMASIILIITLFGLWLGIAMMMLYFVSLTVAASIMGIIFGTWLAHLLFKKKDYSVNWKIVVGGVVAITLVGLVPLIGWIIMMILTLVTLGAFYRAIFMAHK